MNITCSINALAVERQAEGVSHSANTFLKGINSRSANVEQTTCCVALVNESIDSGYKNSKQT